MTAPAFTPGPWVALEEEQGRTYARVRGTRWGERFKIANALAATGHPAELAEARANARLIAAAPELYEAASAMADHLERSLASFERDPPDSDFQDGFRAALTTPEMIERARSLRVALAKARGEQ